MPGGVITQDQSRLLAFLKSPGVLDDEAPIEITTSGAHVLLTEHRAYKLRRAITYSYMDFGTLEHRNRAAVAELRLNRNTAPDLYLGLMPIVTGGDEFFFRPIVETPDTGDDVIEHLVVMHRFDETTTLDRLADRNALDGAVLDQLGSLIAQFHDQTPSTILGAAAQKLANVSGRTMRDLLATRSTLGVEVTTLLYQGMQVSLIQAMKEVDERGATGHIKRLHGDLHLANVAMIDGAPVLFDALEFDDAMATVDELHDIAFVIMDIWARGQPGHAARVWSRYLAERDDYSGLALAPLYIAMRAAVRAKVALNAATLNAGAGQTTKETEATHYVKTALAALVRPIPRLIAIGGLSGTGKTTLARALAPALAPAVGAIHLRSDVLRKRHAGVDFESHLPPEAYSPASSTIVYAGLLERAEIALKQGVPVIIDAVFAKLAERQATESLAARLNVPFDGLWLDLDLNQRQDRIKDRRSDASDATPEVAAKQHAYELGKISWHRLDAGATLLAEAKTTLEL